MLSMLAPLLRIDAGSARIFGITVVSALRSPANDGAVNGEVGWALLACAAVVAVFVPLAVRSYRRQL